MQKCHKIFFHIFQFQNMLHLFSLKKSTYFGCGLGVAPPPVYGPVRNFFFFTPSLSGPLNFGWSKGPDNYSAFENFKNVNNQRAPNKERKGEFFFFFYLDLKIMLFCLQKLCVQGERERRGEHRHRDTPQGLRD